MYTEIDLQRERKEVLAKLILKMGHIIRRLDDSNEYLEYWTQDGEYMIDDIFNEIK